MCLHAFTCVCGFMAWCLVRHKDSFIYNVIILCDLHHCDFLLLFQFALSSGQHLLCSVLMLGLNSSYVRNSLVHFFGSQTPT